MTGQRTVWTEKQYEEFLKTSKVPQPTIADTVIPPGNKKRLTGRTARRIGPNQTEQEFALRFKADYPQLDLLFAQVKLQLADKCWYTPDFFAPTLLTFYEIKGSWITDDGIVKFKVAKKIHSWACFYCLQKKDGIWTRLH
jgi:hypothetical protein